MSSNGVAPLRRWVPRLEQRAGLTSAKRELAPIDARQKKLLDMMLDDVVPVQKTSLREVTPGV